MRGTIDTAAAGPRRALAGVARSSRAPALAAVCCAAGLLSAASGASAQDKTKPAPELRKFTPTGSHVEENPNALKGEQLHQFFDEMARCVVRRAPDRTDYFLRMSDDFALADEVKNIAKFLPLSVCVGNAAGPFAAGSMARFTPKSLRNWLSEKAYLAANRGFVPLGDNAGPVAARAYFGTARAKQAQAFGIFSDCIVAEDAQAADELVRTERGSLAERSAARGLVPAMGKCLPPDQTLSLDQGTIRGLAAQGLWQRYEAPKPPRYKGAR